MRNEMLAIVSDDTLQSGANSIDENNLPAILTDQVDKLNDLDKSIKKAMDAAEKAKEAADSARNMSAGMFKKKEAIEELQSAGIELAEAVQSGAEAQKLSFEFQTKLAEISKYLFGLGVSNIASNRFVVRELELKLKGASKKKLTDLARQEILSVVKQLKEQEDLLMKQEELSQHVRIHEETLKTHALKSDDIAEQLRRQSEEDKYLGERLTLNEEADKRFEEQLKAQEELDRLHSEQLQARAEIDILHSEQIKLQAENDKKLTLQILAQEEVDRIHSEQLVIHRLTYEKLGELLENQTAIDKVHDENFMLFNERIKGGEEQISNLLMITETSKEQIGGNLTKVKEQEIKINSMQDEISNLKVELNVKASNSLLKVTLVIASLAIILAVAALFI